MDSISPCVYKVASSVRESIKEGLEGLDSSSGPAIAKFMAQQESRYALVDPTIHVEVMFMQSMVGAKGQERLQQQFLDLMPSASKQVKAEAVVQKLAVLKASPLYNFCGAGVQGMIRTAVDNLHCIAEGRTPQLSSEALGFLLSVFNCLQYFCHGPGENPTTGLDAIKQELAAAEEVNDKLDFSHIKLSAHFMWLMGEAETVRYKALHGKIVQGQEAVLVHAPSGGAASSKKGKAAFASEPTGSTGKTKKKTSEVEAALAMFKTVVAAKAAGGK